MICPLVLQVITICLYFIKLLLTMTDDTILEGGWDTYLT